MSEVLMIDSVLLLLVAVTAIAVVEVRSLYAAAMLSGIYSLLMALVWVNMHSMDVAFTEAAVGGGISTILLIGTLVHTEREEKKRPSRVNWGALLVTAVTGAALVYGTLDMPRFGDPNAPIHKLRVPEMINQTVGMTSGASTKQPPPPGYQPRKTLELPLGHGQVFAMRRSQKANEPRLDKLAKGHGGHGGVAATDEHHEDGHDAAHAHPSDDFNGHVPNSVTSLLAAYRGYDTMFETAVIFTAGASLILLLRRRKRPGEKLPEQESADMTDQVILRVMCKLFIPFILIFGLYVISHGEIGPGGGFQGGVILATAFILYALIFGRPQLHRVVPERVTDILAAVGVLLYSGVGVTTMLLGGKFLDYAVLNPESPGDGGPLGMTLVEWGVGITVCTVMITIFNQLAEEESK
ncbi:MAG: Na(+)/H(+) antiporter subunit B [Nannocystaceae bacterium]